MILIYYVYQNTNKIRFIVTGVFCFSIGIGLELWFNYLRFGSMLELGYSGQLGTKPAVNYGLEFDYPFHYEQFLSAAKELIGRIFFFNLWQSHTFRDREFDFVVFNASHLIVFVVGVVLIMSMLIFKDKLSFSKTSDVFLKAVFGAILWGTGCLGLLFILYMFNQALHARYLCDFSAAFQSIIIGIVLFGVSCLTFSKKYNGNRMFWIVFFVTFPLFLFNDWKSFEFDKQLNKEYRNKLIDNKEHVQKLVDSFNSEASFNPNIPETFYCGKHYFIPGLKYQFVGWNILNNCSVGASTVFFLPSKGCLILNYSIDNQQALPPVKIKRDLECLKLINSQFVDEVTRNPNLKQITQVFCSDIPVTAPLSFYQIGWVSAAKLNNNQLPIRLNWVSVSYERMKSFKN